MRLIDADALKKNLDTALEERRQGKNVIRQARMNVLCSFTKEALDAMPTIDPVVRCRDCRWYEIYQLKQDGTDDRRYKPSYCTLLRHRFKPDWYCADGEVRDDDTD